MKENDKNAPKYKIAVIIIFLGLGIAVVWSSFEANQLKENFRYALAITEKKRFGGYVDYHFRVNGVVYNHSNKKNRLKINGRYFVKYNTINPSSYCEIVSDEEVSPCIGVQPEDGWEELPKCK